MPVSKLGMARTVTLLLLLFSTSARTTPKMIGVAHCADYGCKAVASIIECQNVARVMRWPIAVQSKTGRDQPPGCFNYPASTPYDGMESHAGTYFNAEQSWAPCGSYGSVCGCICPARITPPNPLPAREQAALGVLYNATNGKHWTASTAWMNHSVPHCEWFGVNCISTNSSTGERELHVSALQLYANALRGSIPSGLSALSQLFVLNLNGNSLLATVPVQLASLSMLTVLNLFSNLLEGTIPWQLAGLSQLQELDLFSNSIGGIIPAQVGTFPKLEILNLYGSSLTGSIPTQLGSLSMLTKLRLYRNFLAGDFPSELGHLTTLQGLWLYSNDIEGTLPADLGSLSNLDQLWLYDNQISGSLPEQLGSVSKLSSLVLYNSSLSGVVPPQVFHLHRMILFLLHSNSLTGTLQGAALLQHTTSLGVFTLSENSLSGTLPWEQLARLTTLNTLALGTNRFTGTLSLALPKNLERLLLGKNSFSGCLPSFAQLSSLSDLTLSDNNFQGRITLQQNNTIRTLLTQNNMLSCSVDGSPWGNAIQYNLLAPGNKLAMPVPKFAAMAAVEFLWTGTFWQVFEWAIVLAAAGLAAFVLLAFWMARGDVKGFFWFSPGHQVEHMELRAIRMLAGAAGLTMPLCVVYSMGSNLYECPTATANISFVGLGNAPELEWVAAAWACVCAAVLTYCVANFREACLRHVGAAQAPRQKDSNEEECGSCSVVGLVWLTLVSMFSVPSAAYAAAASIPSNNTLQLSQFWLNVISELIGPVNYIISNLLSPYLAQRLVREPQRLATFITFSRFTSIVVVPALVVCLMSQECGACWLKTWEKCADDSNSFDVSVDVSPFSWHSMRLQVSTHRDVCTPPYKVNGKCFRTLLDILGTLVTSKLLFAIFVAPFSLVRYHSVVMRWYVQLWRCFRPTKEYRKDLILEFTSVVQHLEYALLFGVAFPIIVPLAAVATGKNLLVIHHVLHSRQVPISKEVAFSSFYLWVCLALGVVWVICLYISNDLRGGWLVAAGMPVGVVLACVLQEWSKRSTHADLQEEEEEEEESKCYHALVDDAAVEALTGHIL